VISHRTRAHPTLHSFPTRRSSDLRDAGTLATTADFVFYLADDHAWTSSPDALRALPFAEHDIIVPGRWCEGGSQPIVLNMGMNGDRKSTRLNSSHVKISYAVFCLK